MGFTTVTSNEAGSNRWLVSVAVNLSRAETNDLFLAGDCMLSWPAEGLLPASKDKAIPERSGMFVSEVASHPSGLMIYYEDQAHAEQAAESLRVQFARAGINEGV